MVLLRRPWIELDLRDFLRGIFAVWTIRARTTVDLRPGVIDLAIHRTIPLLKPVSRRTKVRIRFRMRFDALTRPSSRLASVLRRLEDDGTLERNPNPREPARIRWSRADAELTLDEIAAPIEFLDRASKLLLRQVAAARVAQLRWLKPSSAGRFPRGAKP